MKKNLIVLLFLLNVAWVSAQVQYDSIYTFNDGVIAVTVKEVTSDALKFAYPNEDLLNSISKNNVQKVVFKSGRVQVFSEASAFNKVTCADDWVNVSITVLESEVKGLHKIGDVSVKSKSGGFASSSKVKDRAYNKIKMEAALQGANVVLITDETSVGNKMGSQYQAAQAAETQLSGITYSNTLPKYSNFSKVIEGKITLLISKDYLGNNSTDIEKTDYSDIPITINHPQKDGNFIFVSAGIKGAKTNEFRVTNFSKDRIILMEENKGKFTNYTLRIQ
jgi:hypothetical protein